MQEELRRREAVVCGTPRPRKAFRDSSAVPLLYAFPRETPLLRELRENSS